MLILNYACLFLRQVFNIRRKWCNVRNLKIIILMFCYMSKQFCWYTAIAFFFLILERTQEEIERTKQFSKEVVDLLRHQPHFRMPFNKFIPSYHHHFGRQCKLAYYGFTKLLELFEAIPDVLQVSPKICLFQHEFKSKMFRTHTKVMYAFKTLLQPCQ